MPARSNPRAWLAPVVLCAAQFLVVGGALGVALASAVAGASEAGLGGGGGAPALADGIRAGIWCTAGLA